MEMLEHIRSQYGYYRQATYAILCKKKLDLVDWLAAMDSKNLPADEICLLVCARLLNIHISVDYNTGCWTTFEASSKNHDYIIEKSDIHFIYRGFCMYNFLCRNYELKTTGRKLLDYKLYRMELTKPFSIVLRRIEDYSNNIVNTQQILSDSDHTEIDYQTDNPSPTGQTMSNTDATEIYEIRTDNTVKTNQVNIKRQHQIKTCNKGKEKPKKGTSKLGHKKQSFKCKTKNCTTRLNSRKDLYLHYKTIHKRLHKCKSCDKHYKTPYSWNQHNYTHRKPHQLLTCTKCKMTFAFKSQLAIHRNKHTKYGKYECTECFTVFKYKHDMYRHCREHTAEIIACNKCAYIGTPLNLKEHKRQHSKKFNKTYPLCKKSFNFRMALWLHKKHCYHSDSPEF